MDKLNLRVLSQPAPEDEKRNISNSEIRKRLFQLAKTIIADIYSGVASEKLITKSLIEIQILREIEGHL